MSCSEPYTLILSKNDFYDAVVDSVESLPLKEIFFIDDWYIDRLIRNWNGVRMERDYKRYFVGLMGIPYDSIRIDSYLLIWFVTRQLVDELVTCLAEGFYYDEHESVIGEHIWFEPFDHSREYHPDKEKIKYFLDVLDTMYDRVDDDCFDTLSWLRETIGEDYLT